MVVASLDFRTSNDAPYPAALEDINYATRWFKLHAADFAATNALVGGSGYSSGGHQVMLAAMRPKEYATLALDGGGDIDASLAYVIMGWPVIDPWSRQQLAQRLQNQRLIDNGLAFFKDDATMQGEGNPQHLVDTKAQVELPPALLLQGAADAQLTPGMAEAFVQAYGDAGGRIEYARYPGAPHGFMRDTGADITDRALFETNLKQATAMMKSFISRQLALA
jgi:acetyl esterase/lipase